MLLAVLADDAYIVQRLGGLFFLVWGGDRCRTTLTVTCLNPIPKLNGYLPAYVLLVTLTGTCLGPNDSSGLPEAKKTFIKHSHPWGARFISSE